MGLARCFCGIASLIVTIPSQFNYFTRRTVRTVNLLALRLQWFESTPAQASPRAILQVFKPFGGQLGRIFGWRRLVSGRAAALSGAPSRLIFWSTHRRTAQKGQKPPRMLIRSFVEKLAFIFFLFKQLPRHRDALPDGEGNRPLAGVCVPGRCPGVIFLGLESWQQMAPVQDEKLGLS